MVPFYEQTQAVRLWCADATSALAQEADGSARCCITSPPYWGLRDYGLPPTDWPDVTFIPMAGLPPVTVSAWRGCLGLEPEPMAFVAHLVHVFREVRRVLAEDGTLWLNLGDSYASSGRGGNPTEASSGLQGGHGTQRASMVSRKRHPPASLKNKDLIGIPWRVAFALQADGWYLRSDVVWAKPNPMPESVTDRPTKAHEYVFLLAKSERYAYDADAISEEAVAGSNGSSFTKGKTLTAAEGMRPVGRGERSETGSRNARSVWPIATQPYKGAHFATMPPALAERCLLAGSRPGDTVLDPFNGAGTTGLVSMCHGRRFVGADLNTAYCELALDRWREEFSLFLR